MHDNACPIELTRNNAMIIMQIRNSKWKYASEWMGRARGNLAWKNPL